MADFEILELATLRINLSSIISNYVINLKQVLFVQFLRSKFGLKVAYFSLKSGEKWLISDLVFGYESGLILEMSGGFQNF